MLEDFIESNKMTAQIIRTKFDVPNARAAARALKASVSDIAKSILFVDQKQSEPLLVVLLGDCKIDLEKLEKASGLQNIDLATEKQASEITGYEIGGIPPISIYGVKTIVDKKLMEKKVVFAGGGDEQSILKITPQEIKEFGFEAQIADISSD